MTRPIGSRLPSPESLALAWVAFARLEAVLSQALLRLDGEERATADRLRAEAVELMLLANTEGKG